MRQYLLLEQSSAHGDTLLELAALAVALRLRLHLALALVRRQHVQLMFQLRLLLLTLHLHIKKTIKYSCLGRVKEQQVT